MSDSQVKLLFTGAPQSGKSLALVDFYLQSLHLRPLERRVFIAPNVSYREHIKGVILRRGELEVLPDFDVLTFAEFLSSVGRQSRQLPVLAGKRQTSQLAERAALLQLARRVSEDCESVAVDLPASVEALHQNLLQLRHAGLYLQWLKEPAERVAVGADGEAVGDFLLKLAWELFRHMRDGDSIDDLFRQECTVAALLSPSASRDLELPDLVLIDGFYDLNELEREAVSGLAATVPAFVLALPDVPGDERVARLLVWAREELGLEEHRLTERGSEQRSLLLRIAEAKTEGGASSKGFPRDFMFGYLQVQSFPTYLAEAEFLANSILSLHRREGAPLDSFLVVMPHPEPEFEAALGAELGFRGIPVENLVGTPEPAPLASFLSSVVAYLAQPEGETSQGVILASLGWLDPSSSLLLQELYRFHGFIDLGLARRVLDRAGCENTMRLLDELDDFREDFARSPTWSALSQLLDGLATRFLDAQPRHGGVDGTEPSGQEMLARSQRWAERLAWLLRSDVAGMDAEGWSSEDILALVQQAIGRAGDAGSGYHVGAVYLVDALVARQWQKPYVFVVRADSEHWRGSPSPAVFGEPLRRRLEREGVKLRTSRDEYEFEQSLFLSAITRSTLRTFVTYARRTMEGKELLVSSFVYLLAQAAADEQAESQVAPTMLSPADRKSLALEGAVALKFGSERATNLSPAVGAACLSMFEEQELSGFFAQGGIAGETSALSLPEAAEHLPDSFSPSALTRYRKCPYLYFASRLAENATELETLEEGLTPADVGRAVHLALQQAFSAYPEQSDPVAPFRDRLADIAGAKLLLRRFELEVESEADRWGELLRRFYDDEYSRLKREQLQPVALETELAMPLADSEGNAFSLHGFPDRVDSSVDGDAHFVYDYKTGRMRSFAANEGKLARRGADLAGLCYALLYANHRSLSELPVFAYALVRENSHLVLTAHSSENASVAEVLTEVISRSVSSLRRGRFDRAPHPEVDCESCDYYRLCRRDRFTESLPNEAEQWFPLEVQLKQL